MAHKQGKNRQHERKNQKESEASPSLCGFCESQSSDSELFWDVGIGDSVIVGDGSDADDDRRVLLVLELARDAGDRDGRTVHLRLKQPAEDDLVEARVRSAGQEAIELDEQEQFDILGCRCLKSA